MPEQPFGRPNEQKQIFDKLTPEQQKGITDFLKENELNQYSKKTIKQYRFYLTHLHKTTKKSYITMQKEDIHEFLYQITTKGLNNKPIAASSQKAIYSLINSFFTHHKKPELLLSRKKIKGKINAEREIFTIQERDKFFETTETKLGLKIRTFFEFSYWEALRIDEAITIKPEHIDFKHNKVYIMAGKGNKDSIITLLPKAKQILQKYMNSEEFDPKQKYLFEYFYKKGKHTGKKDKYYIVMIENLFQKMLKETSMTKMLTFHCLRHSCGSHLLSIMGEAGLPYVRKHLRHAPGSPVTLRYIHTINKDIDVKQLEKIGGA